MTTIKSFTDLEQSKKLAEILPIESADMHYCFNFDLAMNNWWRTIPNVTKKDNHFELYPNDIPCWSLAALLDVLPLGTDIHKQTDGIYYKQTDGHKIYYYVEIYTKEIYMKLKRMNKPEICLSSERHENLVDACVEMILRLHEEKLL